MTWPEGTHNPGADDSADCDQGVGNDGEGCDPGRSTTPDNPTNDETPDTGPGNPGKNPK